METVQRRRVADSGTRVAPSVVSIQSATCLCSTHSAALQRCSKYQQVSNAPRVSQVSARVKLKKYVRRRGSQ